MTSHDTETSSEKPKASPLAGLKRAIFALGILVIVWFVFGQMVPRFFFDAKDAEPPPAAISSEDITKALGPYQETLSGLEARLNQMEAKLKILEDLASSPKPETTALPDESLRQWQATIDAKLLEIEKKPAQVPVDETRLAALEARINNQQQAFATIQMQADEKISITTAFAQLKERALRGENFHAPLIALADATSERSDIRAHLEALQPYAGSGLVTPSESRSRFEPLIRKALVRSDDSSLMGNLSGLISVRKTGEPEGTSDEAILARAESKLMRADLQAALAELQALSKPAGEIFAAWVADAKAYEEARMQLAALELALSRPPSIPPQATLP